MRRRITTLVSIVSIQTDQSRPYENILPAQGEVSIVSIQTDQSRRLRITRKVAVAFAFQSYQSKQINPDPVLDALRDKKLGKFQSYQSRQSNPDVQRNLWKSSRWKVSIVSIQTDQSRRLRKNKMKIRGTYCFNRINLDRSIQTDQARLPTILCRL